MRCRRELFHIHKERCRRGGGSAHWRSSLGPPMNVHHWRKLEANDPEYFELIQKAQDLQKALVTKNQEVMDKDLLLKI
ncbi:unnamed protein product [Boreogadus saida]